MVCKVSGLNPAGAWTDETLRPAVDICLDAFGGDRVMYASNFPVCNVATGMAPWIDRDETAFYRFCASRSTLPGME